MKKILSLLIFLCFLVTSVGPFPVYAQEGSLFLAGQQGVVLPEPGVMVPLSPTFSPAILKGIKVHPDNPFRFDFILDKGESELSNDQIKDESARLIKYFLASLTIPEKDLWVNLSPYEKDRIIPQSFGLTEMGRDLLAEDYMLKQITASLIYPESQIGKKFWKRIYDEAEKKFGTTNIPVNTFNKVWIVPQKAVVYENAKSGAAYVVESKLKVMLEQDYLSLEKHEGLPGSVSRATSWDQMVSPQVSALGSQIVREIVIPELTKEVNEDKNFVFLRQVYNSLILATWYKKKIKDSILAQVYADKNKISGVNIDDPQETERIYQRYLQAFKKGVYNYIKEDIDPATQETIPRKYFSGGVDWAMIGEATDLGLKGSSIKIIHDQYLVPTENLDGTLEVQVQLGQASHVSRSNFAMTAQSFEKLLMDSRESPFWSAADKRWNMAGEENKLTEWIKSGSILPKDRRLGSKLFHFIFYEFSLDPGRQIHSRWLEILQRQWHLESTKQLTNLFRWFSKNQIYVERVAYDTFYDFINAYVHSYNEFPGWRDNFNYIINPALDNDTNLKLAAQNIRQMSAMVPAEMIQREGVLKAPIEGTDLYVGMEYGLVESTHGLFLVLGEDKKRQVPLSKEVIFKLGLDSQGDTLRIIMLQGEVGKQKEINEDVPSKLGMYPAIALFYSALQLAANGIIKINNMPDFHPPKQNFHQLLGIRRQYMPALRNGSSTMNIYANYSRFGLRKENGIFGYWQTVEHLMQITVQSRLKKNDFQADSIKKLMTAVDNFEYVSGESFNSEYNRANTQSKDAAMNATPYENQGVVDLHEMNIVKTTLDKYYRPILPNYDGKISQGGEAKVYFEKGELTHQNFYKIFTQEGEQNQDEIIFLKYLERKRVSGVPKVLDWGFVHNGGIISKSDLEKIFLNGDLIFDWLIKNGYFREKEGTVGHPNSLTERMITDLEKAYPNDFGSILAILRNALDIWIHMKGIKEAHSIQQLFQRPMKKSEFFNIDGGIILEKLIDERVLQDISPTEVRLNGDLSQQEDIVRKISKYNFDAIWTILQESNGVKFSDIWNGLSFSDHLDRLAKVARILSNAHKVGISHNDVKPLNIIINGEGEVMLIDWNTATRLGDEQRLGTIGYVAPGEVVKRDKSDVFGMGKTIYYSLTEQEFNANSDVARFLRSFYNKMTLPANEFYKRPSMEETADYLEKLAQKAKDPTVTLEEWHPDETSMGKKIVKAARQFVKKLTSKDSAMTNGGIDLTPGNMNLQTQNAGGPSIKFHLDPAMLRQLQNAPGFVPVIINVQPLNNLSDFLGINQHPANNPAPLQS